MKRRIGIILIIIVACAVLGFLVWPYAFTVVPIQQVEAIKQSETFDPVTYVDGKWESEIKPTIFEKAVDLSAILGEITPDAEGMAAKPDLIKLAEKYGLITVGEAHVYMVKATGTVTGVDTSKSLGVMEVAVDGFSGPTKVNLYIGPRIPSDETSVRDAVGFIQFGDFKEQTEYGKVSAEINKRINTELLAPLDKANLEGKQITFYGAFTLRTFNLPSIDVRAINIVPVKIDVQ
jgi:predicted lipoprotein